MATLGMQGGNMIGMPPTSEFVPLNVKADDIYKSLEIALNVLSGVQDELWSSETGGAAAGSAPNPPATDLVSKLNQIQQHAIRLEGIAQWLQNHVGFGAYITQGQQANGAPLSPRER